jgi:hypothetical protein
MIEALVCLAVSGRVSPGRGRQKRWMHPQPAWTSDRTTTEPVQASDGRPLEALCGHYQWSAGNLLAAGLWKESEKTVCAGGRDRDRTCDFCRVKAALSR